MTSGIAPAHTLVIVCRQVRWETYSYSVPHTAVESLLFCSPSCSYLNSEDQILAHGLLAPAVHCLEVTVEPARTCALITMRSSSVAMSGSTHRAQTRDTTVGLYSGRQECADAISRIRQRVNNQQQEIPGKQTGPVDTGQANVEPREEHQLVKRLTHSVPTSLSVTTCRWCCADSRTKET